MWWKGLHGSANTAGWRCDKMSRFSWDGEAAFCVAMICTFQLTVCFVAGGIAPAGATRGLCDRPLDPFAAHISILLENCSRTDLIRLRFAQPPSPEGKVRGRASSQPSPLGKVSPQRRMRSNKHAGTVWECHQLNRAKGSREELPCGVQRQSLWRLPPFTIPPSLLSASTPCTCRGLLGACGG